MNSFYRLTENGLVLRIYVKTRAKKRKAEFLCDRLRIYVESAPEGGKANQELINFLSKLFSIPSEKVKILRGRKGQIKEVFLNSMDEAYLIKVLSSLKPI